MDYGHKENKKEHPWQKANIFSKLIFFYTRGLFWRVYNTNKLEENDLYDVPHCYRSQKLGDDLEKTLELNLKLHKTASIYRLLWSCYGKEYIFIGFVQLFMRIFVVITIPMSLAKLVLYFQSQQKEVTKNEACINAVLLICFNLINIIYTHNYMLAITALGIKVKTAFCSMMYRKALTLTATSLSEIPVGKIVNLMTKDVTAFEKIILYGNDIWIGFVQTGVVCYLIYRKMGVAAFAGVGFLLMVIPLQVYIAKKATKLRTKAGEKTDERLQLTQETVSAIKFIKMYVWGTFFSKKILESRKREVGIIAKLFFIKVAILLIGGLASKIAFYFLVMTYVWLGHTISAEMVYFILILFQRLRHALSVIIPLGITESAELHASVKRIGSLLKAETLSENSIDSITVTPKVRLKGVTVDINDTHIIKDITCNIDPGLTILTGPLGCGKSTLLKTILQDYRVAKGVVSVSGRISYASQEPWIFPSTIKQNILFGEKFKQSRYEKVLRACALNFDLSSFEGGDNLIVGDQGMNLSKGQKARINLARAIYKDCEIYLLDNCLTAVDANVKSHIYNEVVRGFLRNKLCILVANNLEFLQIGDNLLVMDNGTIKSFSKPNINNMEICEAHVLNQDKFVNINEDSDNDNDNEDTKLLNNHKGREKGNIYHEEQKSGKVGVKVYKKYISYGGGYFISVTIMIFLVLTQSSKSYTEKLVSNWVDIEENFLLFRTENSTNSTEYKKLAAEHSLILILFSSVILLTTILSVVTSLLFFNFTRRVSNRLHEVMVNNILNAVMPFFDTTFIGNILNRFSNDLAIIDENFPFNLYEFCEIFLTLLGIIIMLAVINVTFLLPVAVVLLIQFSIRQLYMPAGRNLQRLESATRSPIVGYLNASLDGLTTIRAFESQKLLTEEFDKHQDLYTSASFSSACCTRAFGLALDTCCSVFIGVITGYFLIFNNDTSVGNIGLAITQAFMLSGLVQYGFRKWTDLENKMTSVERVLEYTFQKTEANDKGLRPLNWPNEGKIKFENVSLTYANSEDLMLKNISFSIKGSEKIGVVGRTGAGKSSIISLLFRLYAYEGKIFIDGVDIESISIEHLRKNIAIIPQDPVLFTGTIRNNIDPLEIYQDADIWVALKKVNLDHLILSLDDEIIDSGLNFSSGQRQLICMTRALLSRNKIVVLDEATASMDKETDAVIYDVIQESFASCTVITIAHKLQSILHCDKVMLIEKGRIVEYDNPTNLVRIKGSFYKMLGKANLLK